MSIKPINGNILVKKIDTDVKVGGGLVIPDFVNLDSTVEYEVIAISEPYYDEKDKLITLDVNVGDIVVSHSTLGFGLGGVYKLLRQKDIIYVK